MTREQIADLRILEREATQGPWSTRRVSWRDPEDDCCDGIFAPGDPAEDGTAEIEVVTTDSGVYGPDWLTARFIVVARNSMARLLDEREALLNALKAAADKLLWANSNLMHSWAQERPCDHEAASEADEGEKAARAAIAKAEAE